MSLAGEGCKGQMPHASLAMSASHQESIGEGDCVFCKPTTSHGKPPLRGSALKIGVMFLS